MSARPNATTGTGDSDDPSTSYYPHGFCVPRAVIVRAAKIAVGCAALHVIADGVLRVFVPAKTLARLSRGDRLFLPEKIVDLVHGLYAGLMAVDIVFVKSIFEKDCFRPHTQQCDELLTAALGFSLYDMCVMLLHGKEPASMWAHHIMQAYGTFTILGFRHASFFPIIFAVTELTIVPNNLLWLAEKLQGPQALKMMLLYTRVVFFLLFRTFVAPYAFYYAIKQGRLNEHVSKTHPIVVAGSLLNMVAIGGLNVMWTLMMVNGLRKLQNRQTAAMAALTVRH